MLALLFFAACLSFCSAGTVVVWNQRIPNIIPKEAFEHLQKGTWGDYHLLFHMQRKWYQIGTDGRDFLKAKKVAAAPLQEGFPGNGVEFLCMHRAMIEHLDKHFGHLPTPNDPDGRKTFKDVLQGWTRDEDVTRALIRLGGDADTFREGLDQTNDFASFESEDDFGNYLQTATRPGTLPEGSMLMPDGEPAKRAFTYDRRPGAGVHNWLHGEFQEGRSSPIDVGNAQTNLGNIMFWRIHGWIEAKWKAYERFHKRTAAEQMAYDNHMSQYRRIMETRGPNPVHVPTVVSQNVKPVVLSNVVDCSRITPHTVTDDCPNGRTTEQTTPRVNNGTVCIIDTAERTLAEEVLVQRKYLVLPAGQRPDGVWDRNSQDALLRWLQTNRMQPTECLTRSVFDMLKVLFVKPTSTARTTKATLRPTTARTTKAPSRWFW